MGGSTDDTYFKFCDDFYEVKLSSKRLIKRARMPMELIDVAACYLKGKIFITYGTYLDGPNLRKNDKTFLYSIREDFW